MRNSVLIGMVAGMLFSAGTWADTAQQERMKSCNAEAGQKKLAGDARKDFMKSCLSGSTAKNSSSQQRMKDCNAEASAKSLKGDARKDFMKSCLSTK